MVENLKREKSSPDSLAGINFFGTGPEHTRHANSTRIIYLEESGQILCPLCLETFSCNEFHRFNEDLYNQFVRNLFEALDQNCGRDRIRRVVLQMLEILLRTRPVELKDDCEFHNVLRILHKIMKTSKFEPDELYPMASIMTAISLKYTITRPVPLSSIWKTSQLILEYAKKHINEHVNINIKKGESFIKGILKTVQTYLVIIGKFSLGQVSDIIFPLHENDTPDMHSRRYYVESQLDCIKFMRTVIIPVCWPRLNITNRVLEVGEISFVSEIVSCIDKCYKTSLRLNYSQFGEDLTNLDILQPLYLLIHKNSDSHLRNVIRSFIGNYILNEVKSEFKTDIALEEYFIIPGSVEVNHRNAITYSRDQIKYRKTMFYLLLNYVAMKRSSSYYNSVRLVKVIKSVDPDDLRLFDSTAFGKIYNFLVTSVANGISSFDNVANYFRKTWSRLRDKPDISKINEEFCFDPQVFFWASESSDFALLARESTIKEVLQASRRQNCLHTTVISLLKNKTFRRKFASFLRNDESSLKVMLELLDQKEGNQTKCSLNRYDHSDLMRSLSEIIAGLLQHTVLQYLNGTNEQSSTDRIVKIASLINVSLVKCEHFNIIVDSVYASDLFKFLDRLFSRSLQSEPNTLIVTLTRTLTLLIGPRSSQSLRIIKHMNQTVLGIMYQHLADYARSDPLGESIAQLMVVYDDIDYPIVHRVERDLASMSPSLLNWMLSNSKDLHKLSLRVAGSLLRVSQDSSTVACISTGIAHMIINSPKVFEDRENVRLIKQISSKIVLSYNPLTKFAMKDAKETICEILSDSTRPMSPAISFDSESSVFEEEHASISRILNRLSEDDDVFKYGDTCRIPKSLYASQAIEDQYLDRIDFSSWEQRAYETASHIDTQEL